MMWLCCLCTELWTVNQTLLNCLFCFWPLILSTFADNAVSIHGIPNWQVNHFYSYFLMQWIVGINHINWLQNQNCQTKFICHIYNHIKQWNASNIHVAFHGQAVVLHEHYCHCCYTEPSFPEGLLSYKREVSVLGCNGFLIILKMKTLMHPKVHGCFGSAERVHIKLPCFSAGTSLSADLNINIPLKHQ